MAGTFKHGKDTGAIMEKWEFEQDDLHTIDGINFGDVVIISNPPSGHYRVVNLYCEKVGAKYKLVVVHEDVPQP